MKRNGFFVVVLVLSLLLVAPTVGATPPEYTGTDLGQLDVPWPYGMTWAVGINDRGQVVGHSFPVDFATRGWLWERGEMVDIGLPPSNTFDGAAPTAINNRGQIVGNLYIEGSDVPNTAFMFDRGDWTVIKGEGADNTEAVDINSQGQVLGYEYGSSIEQRIFIWNDGVFTYLDLPGDANPQCINERGQVLARYWTGTTTESVVWDDGVTTDIGGGFIGADMNDRGQVVGQGPLGDALVWKDGVLTILPGLGGIWEFASSINNRGQIAGSATTEGGQVHAVIWDNGTIIDLGTETGGCYPYDINASGQVVGGCTTDFGPRAYLWEK